MESINPERILPNKQRKEILKIALSHGMNITISNKKESDEGLEQKYYLIEAIAQRKRSSWISFLKMLGLVKKIKTKKARLTMAVTSIEKEELFLVSPERDYEEWFGNFLNSLEKEGWKIFQYEYITRGR